MSDDRPLTPLEALAKKKAELLQEAAIVEQDMAELQRMSALAAKYNYVLMDATAAGQSLHPMQDQLPDETIGTLARLYQEDPRSPIHKLRFRTRETYSHHIKRIKKDLGPLRIDSITPVR